MLLLLAFASLATALLPVSDDRFVTDSFLVSSVQPAPENFTKYSIDSLSKSTSQSATTNSSVLNLRPGISLLETDSNNECYFVNTTIGTTEYPLIIDTGSAYLWVYGSDCDDVACEDEALYTETASQSATSTFALAYVTGTASGDVVEDNIIVNKLATTTKFRFGMADTVPDFFEQYPVSGIFGLPSNDSSSIESIISALYESNAISKKRFSICLGQVGSNDSDYSNAGIFAIGEPIDELYTGEIHYAPLMDLDSLYWEIVIDSVAIDSYVVTFNDSIIIDKKNTTTERTAIVDSGTTVLALPQQDALDVHSFFTKSVTDGTNFAIFCNSTLEISLNLNGKNFSIGPDEYLGEEYSSDSDYAGYCVSNIQGVDSDTIDSWILGAVFLKTVYADFDVENQQVGFASRNDDIVITSTATTTATTATSSATSSGITTSTASSSTSSNHTSSYKDTGVSLSISFSLMIPALIAMLM